MEERVESLSEEEAQCCEHGHSTMLDLGFLVALVERLADAVAESQRIEEAQRSRAAHLFLGVEDLALGGRGLWSRGTVRASIGGREAESMEESREREWEVGCSDNILYSLTRCGRGQRSAGGWKEFLLKELE
eukprot:scaffold15170_cov596-Ochromonas_danica.AAC.1